MCQTTHLLFYLIGNIPTKYPFFKAMKELLATYRPITLEEMKDIKLMSRIDTKFVTSEARLMQLLEMARDKYLVQETGGLRLIPYSTLYFDTTDLQMYTAHHNGGLPRQKLRVRSYVASHLSFLEVKTKNNHRRTRKKRMEFPPDVPDGEIPLIRFVPGQAAQEDIDFLTSRLWLSPDSMVPQIANSFDRITLVNNDHTERLTIDTSLKFHNITSGRDCDLTGIAIIELKRDGRVFSPIMEMLRELRIKPMGFSKYCMGTALTNPAAQTNRFKERLRTVERIIDRKLL